jgi:hypothetical protein
MVGEYLRPQCTDEVLGACAAGIFMNNHHNSAELEANPESKLDNKTSVDYRELKPDKLSKQ